LQIKDGRHQLQGHDRSYDVIETDALLPYVGGSGHVYSVEFFQIAARRLRRNGLMCTWAPTSRVTATFSKVFPHIIAFQDGLILVGSMGRIPLDREAWLQRARSRHVREYLGPNAIEVIASLQNARLLPPENIPPFQPNEDLNPRDEFRQPMDD
jgi:spermidine synthase